MEDTQPIKSENQSVELSQALWLLVSTASAAANEYECARLVTTGIPSLIPCDWSGVALRDPTAETWDLIVQKEERLLPSTEANNALSGFDSLFSDALLRGKLIVDAGDGKKQTALFKKLGAHSVVIVPLRTLRNQLGMLFIGIQKSVAFGASEEFIVHVLAENLAIGVENLRLNEALEQYTDGLKRRNELILRAAGEGIYGLDASGKTTFVNPAAAEMLGWGAAELIDQPMHALPHHSRPDGSAYPKEQCPIYAAFKDGKVHRVDNEVFWRKDGSSFPVEYTSTPISEQGKLEGAVVVFWDITERKRAEEALRTALTEVRELKDQLQAENIYLQEEIKTIHNFGTIIGNSTALKKVLHQVEQVAAADATVLVLGETGTGKELFARAIHELSGRKDRALVKLNCAALPPNLVESELFGHKKGSFTGALVDKMGRFELADGGTMFLDEIGDMPLEI